MCKRIHNWLADFRTPPKSQTFHILDMKHVETPKAQVMKARQANADHKGSREVLEGFGGFVFRNVCQKCWAPIGSTRAVWAIEVLGLGFGGLGVKGFGLGVLGGFMAAGLGV